jgi:AraC family transcriptional regulator, exoenzyme S synthesis regulatory protein ExsA
MHIYEHKTLSYKDKAVFEKLVIGSFKRIPKIFHEREACFMFIKKGTIEFRTPEKVMRFDTGDAMLSKCGNYFFEQNKSGLEGSNDKTSMIGAYFYPSIVKELFDYDLSVSDFELNYDTTKINIDSLIINFLESINFLLDNPSVAGSSLILTKLKEFLLLLSKTENAPSINEFVASLFKPYEYYFKTTIENNLFSNLSIGELSHLCGMSVASFKRKFVDTFNTSPKKYILKRKMEKASDMLSNGELRIVDIAYDCGFESISTFNRSFKKQFLKSPSAYRLSLNAQSLS